MGALANAVQLLRNDTLWQYAQAAAGYVARVVLAEPNTAPDADIRKELAQAVLVNPQYQNSLFVTAIATDPEIAILGTEIGDGKDISEAAIISAIETLWTPIAVLSARPTGQIG